MNAANENGVAAGKRSLNHGFKIVFSKVIRGIMNATNENGVTEGKRPLNHGLKS